MQVRDILRKKSAEVLTIRAHQSLHAACRLLAEYRIGVLMVVDDAHNPIGIISERDIVRAVAMSDEGQLRGTVADVMTTDLIIALMDDELNYVSNTMTQKRIRHLPVLEEGKMVGIVSIGDVVKAQLDYYEGEAHTLRAYISGGYG